MSCCWARNERKKVKLEIVGSSHRAIVRDTPALKKREKVDIAVVHKKAGGKQVSCSFCDFFFRDKIWFANKSSIGKCKIL